MSSENIPKGNFIDEKKYRYLTCLNMTANLANNATKKSTENGSFGDSSDSTAFSLLFHILQHQKRCHAKF